MGASIIGLTPVNVTNFPLSPSVIAYQAAGSILAVSGSFSSGNTSVTVNNIVTGQSSVQVLNPVSLLAVNPNPSSVYVINPVSTLSIVTGNTSVNAYQGGPWSVATLQGTNPWVVSNTSVTAFQGGAWATSMVGGPIRIQSILGTYLEKDTTVASAFGIPFLFKTNVTTSVLSTVSDLDPLPIEGSVTALQGTNPWMINMPSPSVVATQIAGSLLGARLYTGVSSVELMSTSASIAVLLNRGGASVLVNNILTGNSSVQLITGIGVIGSVAVLQGTAPWLVNVPTPSYLSIQPGGSVLNANISGSVAARLFASSVSALQGTEPWVIGSIVGTYAEDAVHGTTDKGIFTLNVRNDTMSSVTSADGDYGALSVGPVGEAIVANSPITKWVSGRTSVMNGVSVQALAAPGASIFTYITGINVINESANTARVTITQGLGAVVASMLTWVIAPAGGGSNSTYLNPIRVLDNNGVSASVNSATASIYVTITGFTAKI